jgi:HlyD family secretion protein
MRFSRPRFTIRGLMILVVIAGLMLTGVAAYRKRIRTTALQSATADYVNARLTREVAELAVVEYKDGVLKSDLATIEGEIALAESDLRRVRASSTSDNKAKLRLEHARERLDRLKYTGSETLKALQVEVDVSKANELAKKEMVDLLEAAFARQWW